MTNIILKIEQANDKNNAFLKDNADKVMKLANELYAPKMGDDALGTDDYREWLFQKDKAFAEYMYDEMGKPNKKGISKPVMSQHKKNIFAGIKTIATDNDGFLDWAGSDIGNEVSSLAKVTASINKYQKSLVEPETSAGDDDAGDDTETETSAGDDAPISIEDMARDIIAKLGRKDADALSIAIADLLDAGEGNEKQSATA